MSRRAQIQMSEDDIRSYLEACAREGELIRFVSNGRDGFPHALPMNFWVRPESTIEVVTYAASQKVANIERDPRVTVLLDSGRSYAEYRAVVVRGRAKIVRDTAYVTNVMRELRSVAGPETSEATAKAGLASAPKRVVIQVTPEGYLSWDHRKLHGAY